MIHILFAQSIRKHMLVCQNRVSNFYFSISAPKVFCLLLSLFVFVVVAVVVVVVVVCKVMDEDVVTLVGLTPIVHSISIHKNQKAKPLHTK